MPFLDSNLVFFENQGLESDGKLEDILDLETSGAADAQLGYVYWNIVVDVTGTNSNSVSLELVTSDNSDLTTGARPVAVFGGEQQVDEDDLKKGDTYSFQVPTKQLDKYVGVWLNTGGTTDAAKITSWLGMEPLADLKMQKEPS